MNTIKQLSTNSPLIVLLGPTASGKTRLGVHLANEFGGEIISADSRQVFKGMDIGSGKDLREYGHIPYHLIDIALPGEEYNLFRFSRDFCDAFLDIHSRDALPFLVGGTGMYLDAVLQRYTLTDAPVDPHQRSDLEQKEHNSLIEELRSLNPVLHNRTDISSKERTIRALEIARAEKMGAETLSWPDYDGLVLGLQYPREITRQRITDRLKSRLNEGMILEVENLLAQGVESSSLEHYGLEYRYVTRFVTGQLSFNDMHQKLQSAIHQFAKQQEKWFRNIEKKGTRIHWLDPLANPEEQASDLIRNFLGLIQD